VPRRAAINGGCALDLSTVAFPAGTATRTLLGKAEIVRDTVVHEIAHHFGISDERLKELKRGDAD